MSIPRCKKFNPRFFQPYQAQLRLKTTDHYGNVVVGDLQDPITIFGKLEENTKQTEIDRRDETNYSATFITNSPLSRQDVVDGREVVGESNGIYHLR